MQLGLPENMMALFYGQASRDTHTQAIFHVLSWPQKSADIISTTFYSLRKSKYLPRFKGKEEEIYTIS